MKCKLRSTSTLMLLFLPLVSARFIYNENRQTVGDFVRSSFVQMLHRSSEDYAVDYDLFPPAVGIILDNYGVTSFNLTLTRGRLFGLTHSTGAFLSAGFEDSGDVSVSWERLAAALRVIAGPVNLDSLVKSRAILPVDLPGGSRALHIPQQSVCTENIVAILQLLPCRGKSGLGLQVFERLKDFAGSPIELTISGLSHGNLLRLDVSITSSVTLDAPSSGCPFATAVDLGKQVVPTSALHVAKKVSNDIYTEGVLSVAISREGGIGEVELFERFPFFMKPLIGSLTVSDKQCSLLYDILPCSPEGTRRDLCIHFLLSSELDSCTVSFTFLREFIRSTDFTFVAEKGFDVSGVYYRQLGFWQPSNSVIAHVVTPDFSMNYNAIALCLACLTLIYGAINRRLTTSTDTKPSMFSRLFAVLNSKIKRD